MEDSEGNPFLYCTSFDTPAAGTPSFGNFCSNQELQVDNTCSAISDIDSISNSACSDTGDISQVLSVLCSDKTPVGKVKNIFGEFGVGRVVLGLLDVACAANPTLSDVQTVCSGIGTLSKGCPSGSSGSSGGSASSATPVHSNLNSLSTILITLSSAFFWVVQ
ncbi:hypothetical protein BDN72DRAFT_302260 [Pluteus cervinus]|uniref:Uncharacterized protein n=1 Tax=Pluteus cervinus TaxID=181527 RepID=A0ACD3B4R4_9AGAR|nr:hypothetical protein BDN72DRAFT_302260 [Pluteus cervinus]